MAVLIGPFDPLQLTFNLLNTLMQKGIISYLEARAILRQSLDPSLPEAKKDEIVDSLIRRV